MASVLFVILAGAAFVGLAPFAYSGDSCGSPVTAVSQQVPEVTQAGRIGNSFSAESRDVAHAEGCRDGGRDRLIWAGLIAVAGLLGVGAANLIFPSSYDDEEELVAAS